MILRKESRNMSIECKTLFVSVWDAVMKLTAVGKNHFNSDVRNFKNIKLPPPPPFSILHTIFKDECIAPDKDWRQLGIYPPLFGLNGYFKF